MLFLRRLARVCLYDTVRSKNAGMLENNFNIFSKHELATKEKEVELVLLPSYILQSFKKLLSIIIFYFFAYYLVLCALEEKKKKNNKQHNIPALGTTHKNIKNYIIIIIMIYTTCDLYYMYNFQYDV